MGNVGVFLGITLTCNFQDPHIVRVHLFSVSFITGVCGCVSICSMCVWAGKYLPGHDKRVGVCEM